MSKVNKGQFERRPGRKPKPLIYDKNNGRLGQAFINDVWLGQTVFARRGDEALVKELITYVIERVKEAVAVPPEHPSVVD